MGLVHLLLNPSATGRKRRRREDALRSAIRSRGHDLVELVPDAIEQIGPTITAARSEGLERLVIAGGDGLIHHALPAVADTPVAVGIVPIGTGNDFSRALGIALGRHRGLQTAVDDALADGTTPVDLVSAPGPAWAATVVTGGFSGRVNARANGLRFPPGQQRYTVATLLELGRLEPFELSLTLDGTVHHLEATLFAIANTRYFGGGMVICPDARPDDGELAVTVIGAAGRFTFARLLPTVFSGRHVNHELVTTYRARHVEVTVPAGCELWADGEPFTNGPFRAASSALNVAGRLVGLDQGFE